MRKRKLKRGQIRAADKLLKKPKTTNEQLYRLEDAIVEDAFRLLFVGGALGGVPLVELLERLRREGRYCIWLETLIKHMQTCLRALIEMKMIVMARNRVNPYRNPRDEIPKNE